MILARRKFLSLAASAAALSSTSHLVWAQTYPLRPVQIIIGFPAGSGNDGTVRLIGQWLSERFDQPFVVENRPGAATNIAVEAVVRAPADGYTLLYFGATNAINATLYENLNFNFVHDIVPIAGVGRTTTMLVVNPSFPARNLPEFIDYARNNPGKLTMASPFSGSPTHLAAALFKVMTGIDMRHVTYPSDAPALIDLVDGKVQVNFSGPAAALEYITPGRLRALAVTTTMRSELLPDIPTIGEFVAGYEFNSWQGIGAPRNTPAEVVDKLNKEINAGLADPKVKARLAEMGYTPMPMTAAEFRKFVADETEKLAKVVKLSGAKPE
jgi:tripartite-type tricarboxylate transporter receptor subunit TctC